MALDLEPLCKKEPTEKYQLSRGFPLLFLLPTRDLFWENGKMDGSAADKTLFHHQNTSCVLGINDDGSMFRTQHS